MCSILQPDCGYDNTTITLIVDMYCSDTKCLGKFCLQKKTFQSLGRSDYQKPQCASLCQLRNIPFEDQTNSFFLSFGPGVYVFEESPKSIQDVIGDVYCPAKYCLNLRNTKLLVVMLQLLDPFMVATTVEHSCLFTKLLSRYKST